MVTESEKTSMEQNPTTPEVMVHLLQMELYRRGEHPPGRDEVMGAVSAAVADLIEDENYVRDRHLDIFKHRFNQFPEESLPVWAAAHLVFAGIYKQILRTINRGAALPQHYKDKDFCKPIIWWMFEAHKPHDPWDEYSYDLKHRKLNTNIVERYIPPELLLQAFPERFGPKPDLLDFGSSLGEGLKVLATPDDFFFKEPKVIEGVHLNGTLTRIVRSRLRHRVPLGFCLGTDLLSINPRTGERDPEDIEWVRSNTIRPKDLEDPNKAERFEKLVSVTPPNVKLITADMSQRPPVDVISQIGERQFKMSFISTVLYGLKPQSRVNVLKNALDLTSDFIVVKDFLHAPKPGSLDLEHTHPTYETLGYRTVVLDMHAMEEGWQVLLEAADSRMRLFRFGDSPLARTVVKRLVELDPSS